MRNEPRRTIFFKQIKAGWLLGLLLFCCSSASSYGNESASKVFVRPELARSRRVELAVSLRRITGWAGLDFDVDGALRLGTEQPTAGSPTARELLTAANKGQKVIIFEDASGRQDVVFCRVVEGKWVNDAAKKPPVFVVLIDFTDFSHVRGDKAALAAFNVGWGTLHEIEHVVNDSIDAVGLGEAGQCESFINRMRRECGLAERSEYFFTFLPGSADSAFVTRFVRIAFEIAQPVTKKRARYWLVWDASLVGGLKEQKALAARL